MVLDGTVEFLRECLVRDRETGRGGRDLPCIDPSQDRPWKENVCIDRRGRRRRAIPFALLHLSSPPAKARASLPQTTERKPNLVRDPIQPTLSMKRIFGLNGKVKPRPPEGKVRESLPFRFFKNSLFWG